MRIDKDKIAEFIYVLKLQELKQYNDKFGIDEANIQYISFKDLPFHGKNEEDFDLDYLYKIVDYFVDI